MKMTNQITDAELEIMKVLWEKKSLTLNELVEELSKDEPKNKSTIKTEGRWFKLLSWIFENLATLLICLGLLAIIAAIIISQIKNKKRGKSSCGENCGCCPMGGSCKKHL